MTEKSLVKKLAEITKNIGPVEKTGWNNFNKYKYVTEADVQAITSRKMAQENLIMFPYEVSHETKDVTTRKGNVEQLYTGTWDFTIKDGDSGEELIIRVSGQGQDSGDKASFKALTGAHKYALMKLFQISTGDDPERDEGHPQDKNNNYNNGPSNQAKTNNHEQQPMPPNVNELNDRITFTMEEIKKIGGNMGIIRQQFMQAMGLENMDNYNKMDLLKFLQGTLNDMKQHQNEQGSLLEGRTTKPATSGTNWGAN